MAKWHLFEPCRNDDHDDCAVDSPDGLVTCACDCHQPWEPDRAYAAGYAYACGYHD